jgi:hypothetical protein
VRRVCVGLASGWRGVDKKGLIGDRTGAPNQRGAIVNISSIFGRVTHPTVGAVSGFPET